LNSEITLHVTVRDHLSPLDSRNRLVTSYLGNLMGSLLAINGRVQRENRWRNVSNVGNLGTKQRLSQAFRDRDHHRSFGFPRDLKKGEGGMGSKKPL